MDNIFELITERARSRYGSEKELSSWLSENISQEKKREINDVFIAALKNESTKSDIFSDLKKIPDIFADDADQPPTENPGKISIQLFYELVRNLLRDQEILVDGANKRIVRRRGANGGFQLVLPEQVSEIKISEVEDEINSNIVKQETSKEEGRKLEKHFYPLVREWALNNDFVDCQITGGLLPGPKWENPDLIDIFCEFDPNTARLTYEIACFEVKLRVEPEGVWQAAHYKKFSHYSFVAFAQNEQAVLRDDGVIELAVDLGLGILALDGNDETTTPKFKIIHHPKKNNPSDINIGVIVSRFSPKFPEIQEKIKIQKGEMIKNLMDGNINSLSWKIFPE